MRNALLEREVALLCALQKMREEMDRAWKDFFEKNPESSGFIQRLIRGTSYIVPVKRKSKKKITSLKTTDWD